MTPRSASWLLLAIALGPAAVARAADEPLKGDLAKLQGSWTSKVGPEKDVPITLTFKGPVAELSLTLPDGRDIKLVGEIRLDDSASPKKADWVKFANPQGDEVPDNLAIYKLEEDTWTVCSGGPGKDRPSEFKAGEAGSPNLTVWTRVKPAKAAEAPSSARDELARFQGKWKAMTGPGGDLPVTLAIKGNEVTASWPRGDGERDELRGQFRVNEKAEPRAIDFFGFKKADGEPMKDNLGIYAFDGEVLRICVGGPDEQRPSEFKADPEGFPLVLLLRKERE